jgi:general secretion pathway protein A
MYEAFYGFREKPFNLTPDPKFLYLSEEHQEAFAHLEFGLRQRGGFIVVTGEVGTGKTTLCRYFLEKLDESTVSAFILYPALGTTELLRSVNRDLGIAREGDRERTDKELIDELHGFLLRARAEGKNTVLVIDEAQNLSRDVLEQVRLISNLETATEKLIQIVLIGQSELNEKLDRRDLRQLAQRITARYHLNPLSRKEMTHYVRHRLRVGGGLGRVDFTNWALYEIHRFSRGIPRLINLVCDRSLLAGYVLEKGEIDRSVVRRAVKELGTVPVAPDRRALARLASFGRRALWLSLAVTGGLGAAYMAPGAVARFGSAWPAPAPVDPGASFDLKLMTLAPETSRRTASAAPPDSELETSMDRLPSLRLPAILELAHPLRSDRLFVTLTSLDSDAAVVYFSPGDFVRIPKAVLGRYWNGRARLFQRDFGGLESATVREP